MDKFIKSIGFVLKWEGGYVNHPSDPGGETRYGISKKTYPKIDIKNLTKDEAIKIYEKDFWIPSGAVLARWPLCLVILDAAVNMGVKRSLRWVEATEDIDDALVRAQRICDLREAFYQRLAKMARFKVFLKGWLNRLNDLRKTSGI